MSLLELVIATTLLAVVMTSVSVVLRTGRQAWEAHEASYARVEAAQATLRHIVREVRQADDVVALSAADDNSGSLSLEMRNGDIKVWDHDAGTNSVNYGIGAANSLLAPDITGLRFTGFETNGTTTTTLPEDVQALRVEVTIPLPAGAGGSGVFSSWAWVRSW
jgi:type II secretory pathway pseudopilin PulG